jgi:oligoendopeptidase F
LYAEHLFLRRFRVSRWQDLLSDLDGKRSGGFSNFGRKAIFFRREPARAKRPA